MSGMELGIGNADYWAKGNWQMASMRGARLTAIFGTAMPKVTKNAAFPNKPMRIRGAAPELFAQHARFTAGFPSTARSLWTGVEATAKFSWIVVARGVRPDLGNCPIISNTASPWLANPVTSPAIPGQAMYLNNTSGANNNQWRLTGQCSVYQDATVTTPAASTPDYDSTSDPWQIFMVRRDAAGTLYSEIVGVTTDPKPVQTSLLPAALGGELIIGSQNTAVTVAQTDIAFLHMADDFLPDDEGYACARQIRAFCDDHSIPILAPLGIPD